MSRYTKFSRLRPTADDCQVMYSMKPVSTKAATRPSAGVSLGLFSVLHAANDQYNAFLAAIMPLLIDRFGFGLGIAGILAAVQSTSTSFAQPVFGWFLDRARRQPSILLWPAVTAISLSLYGLVPSYHWLFPLLIIGGLSTAAFHPHATAAVPAVAGSRAGLGMAFFVSGGTVGYALGPVIIIWVVQTFGLEFTWLAALPTLALCLVLYRLGLGSVATPALVPEHRRRQFPLKLAQLRPLAAVFSIVALRSTIGTAYMSFLGVHLREIGFPYMQVGVALMSFTAAGAVGGMIGGYLSDRLGRKTIILTGLALIGPAFWLLLQARGSAVWMFMPLAGFAMASFNPVTVVMAQDLLPNNRGTAAGLIMGLGWSVGGLLVGIVGALAQAYGLQVVLGNLLWLLIPALAIALTLPGKYGRADAPVVRQEQAAS